MKSAHFLLALVIASFIVPFSVCAQTDDEEPSDGEMPLLESTEDFGITYDGDEVTSVTQTFEISSSSIDEDNFQTNTVTRDLRVTFFINQGQEFSVTNRTFVRLNGIQVFFTPFISTGPEREFQFTIPRDDLRLGTNEIEFAPIQIGDNAPWGIRGIVVEYLEPLEFVVGENNAQAVGTITGGINRPTGARININLEENDTSFLLGVDGFDIGSDNEVEVLLNGNSAGFLARTNPFTFSRSEIAIPPALTLVGANQIEFRQSLGITTSNWGIRNFSLSPLLPDLALSAFEIITDPLERDEPFSVDIQADNLSEGEASGVSITFFLSDDDEIDDTDQALQNFEVDDLNGLANQELSFELATAEIDTNQFLGACISSDQTDSDVTNNCTSGIELKGRAVVAPIINLVL